MVNSEVVMLSFLTDGKEEQDCKNKMVLMLLKASRSK